MLYMWSTRPCSKELLAEKLRRGAHVRPRAPLLPVGLMEDQVVTVSVVKSSAATLIGELAGRPLEMMLDSGSAVSLIIKEVADNLQDKLTNIPIPQVRLITASGEPLPIIGCVQAPVKIMLLTSYWLLTD